MKKVVLFLLILLFPIIVNAEKTNRDLQIDTNIDAIEGLNIDKDGNSYFTGRIRKAAIEKYNSNKELVSTKNLDDYDYCFSMDMDSKDNIYVLCKKNVIFVGYGIEERFFNEYEQYDLIKLNTNLEIIYKKSFMGQYDISVSPIIKVINDELFIANSEYIFDGYSREDDEKKYFNYLYNSYIYKMNEEDGEIQSKKPLRESSTQREIGYYKAMPMGGGGSGTFDNEKFVVKDDHFYILIDGILAKCDFNGNIIWSKVIIQEPGVHLYKITESNDGNIVVVGGIDEDSSNGYSFIDVIPILAVVDPDGNVISQKKTETNGKGYISNIHNADHGYYIIYRIYSGEFEGINPDGTTGDYVVKTDYNFKIKDVIKTDYRSMGLVKAQQGVYVYEAGNLVQYTSVFEDNNTEKEITMGESISLGALFDVDLSSADWSIDDPSIIKIEDKKIVSLKPGTTIITSTFEGNDYIATIVVKEVTPEPEKEKSDEPKNPNTVDYILISVALLIMSALVLVKKYNNSRRKKNV